MGKVLIVSFEENEETVLKEFMSYFNSKGYLASVYKGIHIKNRIMDCQPTEFTALS